MTDNLTNENDLPAEAQTALQAYRDMSESKNAYFSLLQEIDSTNSSSKEQEDKLAELLKVHDENVQAYHHAMHAIEDIKVRDELIKHMM